MGYSHYWRQPYEIERAMWGKLLTDFKRLLPPLRRAGVALGDAYGQGEPLLNLERISLNGASHCGHEPSDPPFLRELERLGVEGLLEEKRSVPPEEAWRLDWEERRCPGTCVFETFEFCRIDEWSPSWHSCKTNRRHYDLAVTCFLIVAKHHLKDALELEGIEELWFEARLLCQQNLGYGLALGLFKQPV